MLSYEFCEIFKKLFLQNTFGRLLLGFFHSLSCFFATRFTNRNPVFSIFEHVLSRLSNVINIMNFAFIVLCETDDPVVAAGKFFAAGISLRHQELAYTEFLCSTVLYVFIKSHRNSCRCDSVIQRCSLNKLFLNISQY